MSSGENLIEVPSKLFEYHLGKIITRLWGPNVSDNDRNSFSQKLLNLLKQHNITSLSLDDLTLIITSAINRAFMHPLNHLELFITEDCNLRCDHCFIHGKNKDNRMPREIGFEAIDFLMAESGKNKDVSVVFFGGEPLLEFELMKEIVEYTESIISANGKKVHFDATTNGTLITEDILKFSNGRIKYLISIDGDIKTHNKHRRTINGEGSFNAIMSKLPLIKKYQPWLGARMTVYPDTTDMLAENVAYLFSNGFNQFIIGPSYGPAWDEAAYTAYEKQLEKIAAFYIERKENKDPFRMTFFENESGNRFCKSNIWGCWAGRNSITVSVSGKLYPCSRFLGLGGPTRNSYCLGDVFTGFTRLDIREEFEGMDAEQFHECINCDAIDYCTGGCPAANYNDTGCISKPSPFECAIAKINKRVLQKFDKLLTSDK